MINLLLVDDHPHQLASLTQMIEDASFPDLVILTAESGDEALDLIGKNAVDILLTDIRMPEMSGIELIRKVRGTRRPIRCVLLSGYADFEYAQQALELRTEKYLMKPVDEAELLAMLRKLIEEIKAGRAEKARHLEIDYAYRAQQPFLQAHLMDRLLHGKSMPETELAKQLSVLHVPLKPGVPYMLFSTRLINDLSGYTEGDIALIRYGISNIADELFGKTYHLLHSLDVREENLMIVFSPDAAGAESGDMPAMIKRLAKELQRQVYRYLKHVIAVGLVEVVKPFPQNLPQLAARTKTMVRSPESQMSGYFASLSDLPEPSITGSLESLHTPPTLLHLLETRRWSACRDKLSRIFEELDAKWHVSEEYAQEAFFAISGSLQYAIHQKGKELGTVLGDHHAGLDLRTVLASPAIFRSWAFHALAHVMKAYEEESIPHYRNVVDRVTKYMEENLDKDLSLPLISEKVGLHPSYLSKLFKQESGTTISEYLTKCRMDKAVRLICDTDKKVYEIAELVGYATTHYFIKLFIRYFGMTPQEYRGSVRNKSK
jgi:two-component system response regulator YesN